MKKIRSIYILALVTLISLAACKPKYDEVSPKLAPITEAVFASGSIEANNAFVLTGLSDAFIIKSNVVENDLVHSGDVLFVLDNRQQHEQVQQAATNLQYAAINAAVNSPTLLQIKANIVAAKAKLQTDSANMGRYIHLYKTNSVSRQEYDNAILTYKTSLSSLQALQESLRASEQKTKQDLDISRSQLDNAKAGNEYYNLTSPGTYRVYQIFKKTGELVRRGDQVAKLGDPDTLIVTLDIDETNIDKVQLGQQVIVELNTQKNKPYEARISKIYPHFNETNQSYKVEARFSQNVPELIAGTQLQANIIVNKKDNALLIPRKYFLNDNKVLVKKGSKYDTTVIKPGIVSDDWVEVLSGITTNDKVAKLK
jgi:multidrug efflux pump subunit AcrA (membrane-fusion protein)